MKQITVITLVIDTDYQDESGNRIDAVGVTECFMDLCERAHFNAFVVESVQKEVSENELAEIVASARKEEDGEFYDLFASVKGLNSHMEDIRKDASS